MLNLIVTLLSYLTFAVAILLLVVKGNDPVAFYLGVMNGIASLSCMAYVIWRNSRIR